ncbi:MAG TPA: anti-sigma factor [Gammaproteobacteria bacterium]|jgi:anti-sigma-K factor RskA
MKYSDPRLQNLLAGEYVLGVLHGAARRRFERLLMESRTLAAEVTAWEGRFASWALRLKPVAPPDYLEWRLMGRVRNESRGRSVTTRNLFWRTWAVAATVVLAIVVVSQRLTPPAQVKAAEFALMSDAKGTPLWLISVHPEANRVDMKVVTPNPPPAGKSYELWMIPDGGKPVPMGLMNETGQASETVSSELLARLAGAKALAISEEPQGGSPTGQPTGPVLWVAPLVTT